MLRTTRRSAAGDAAEWQAEDVTAILNEEAANSTRSSPRKRKQSSRASLHVTSPSKERVQLERPTRSVSDVAFATTASPSRRMSERLQQRKSLSVSTPVNRRDIFAIPSDPEPKDVTKPLLEPIKRLRPLNKRSQQTESPFKGKGILDTRSNALVNLDDSPRKRPVRNRIERIGRSLHNPRRPASKLKETTTITGREPFDGEDIFEASQRADLEQDPEEHVRTVPEEGSSNREISSKASKNPVQSKTQLPGEPRRDADPEIDRNPQAPAKSSNWLAEIAKQALTEGITEPDGVDEVIEESGEEEGSNVANDHERAPAATLPEQQQRPRTQAERDAAERAAAETEAKREQMAKDALSGIEAAVQVHDCKDAWTKSLVAAAEITQNRASSGPESTNGKACARVFKTMARLYKKLHRGNADLQELEHEKRVALNLLRRRCKHICEYHHKPDMRFDRERKRMVRDLYEHLIPNSLEVAKRALKAWFQNDKLSLTALKEICQLLNLTSKLVESAQAWQPRPQLGNAVKSTAHSDVKPNVQAIVENYRCAFVENDRERFVDELEVRQKLNLERHKAEYQRRQEAMLAKYRQYRNHACRSGAVIPDKSVSDAQRQPIGTDEIPASGQGSVPDSQRREGTGHVNGPLAPSRPRIKREPTEDIPPPDETEWSQNELIVLVNALQEFTSESRWEDIIDAYGGPGGRLEKYDMDQIMAKARWVKQSMARQLKDELDTSWDWLRRVPG